MSTVQKDHTPSPVRSRSRGRDFTSSGRGGAGNIRPTSVSRSRDARPDNGPDDFSQTRGRDVAPVPVHSAPGTGYTVTASGRGGVGNIIRSPSRGPGPVSPARPVHTQSEQDVLAAAAERDAELPHSSGRGGFGNILGSRSASGSRSRSRPPGDVAAGLHSSGRGGVGNIVLGGQGAVIAEEEERRAHHHAEGIHSTGRGGTGNITTVHTPPAHEAVHHAPQVIRSSGRGGAGNIREASRPRGD
ncbi:hypothetical protein M422DRAFT_52572 [Sphaerobolus stellatus SS14]|uniref:Uncharacterized protein n=1 Tax=Sphaerobolus stellatus (strain SS14) TaxID=990650 RepID=A0A0C9V6M1_SPHS4|nr:hypothetical protein M422DRAFT_52572 [Sphaerobolus stellatus SS14]